VGHYLDFHMQNAPDRVGQQIQSANMAANPPESRILPSIAGWSWQCGPVLNLPEDTFSVRIQPMAPRDYMMSQTLLVDAGVGLFTGENPLPAT
jgi:hypothetical protein